MSGELVVRLATADVPSREGRKLTVNGREIAVFNLGDRFLAVDNRCPHKSGPLADGIVSGHSVVCPLHAWKIDLETGTVQRPAGESACVRAYETRLEGDHILIELGAGHDGCAVGGQPEPSVESGHAGAAPAAAANPRAPIEVSAG